MGGNSDGVKHWLRSRHISVLDEWVDACIDWIHEEHQGTVLSASQLCKMVYEQWLDSDLAEIATPCLPPDIKQAKKTQLKGNYSLQVNCIQDISSPAYAQLTKLQGRENENSLVSAAPPTQGKFDPPSSRMLMLSLTDGQETVQAMEYRPVPCLTSNLNPGAKIMLSGDMQCRLGVILLTPSYVKILGGEVEALKETNTQEKILARAIGVTPPERPAGSNNQQQTATATTTPAATSTGNITTTTTTARQSTVNNTCATWNPATTATNQQHSNQHQTQQRITSHKAKVKQEPYVGAKKPSIVGQPGSNRSHTRSNQRIVSADLPKWTQGQGRPNQDSKPMIQQKWSSSSRSVQDRKPACPQGFQDPFLDDEDDGLDELMLEELENMEKQEAQKVKTVAAPSHDDWDVGDIDEEELLAMEWESSTGQRQNNPMEQPHQRHHTNAKSASGDQAKGGPSNIKQFSSISRSIPCKDTTNRHSNSELGSAKTTKLSNIKSSSDRTSIPLDKTHQQTAVKTSTTFASNTVPLFKRDVKPPSASVLAQRHQQTVQPLESSRIQHINQEGRLGFDKTVKLPGSSKMAVATRIIKAEPVSQQDKRDVFVASVDKTNVGLSSSVSERRDFVSAQSLVKYEEDEHAAKRMRVNSGPKCVRPFIYLIKMADQLERKEACRFDIKGFIMTLLSSLSHNPSWNLAAKINDGTMSLDVDISDKVLSELIGFSVAEMIEMKADMKKSEREKANKIKETIKQGIGRCQQTLMDLSCIMTIEIKPEYSRPLMVAVRQPTMEDCHALRQCLQESR